MQESVLLPIFCSSSLSGRPFISFPSVFKMLKISLCLALLLLSSYCSADELVPLLAWSNSDILSSARSQPNLQDIFSEVDTADFQLVVILKSNVLSFDDIAKYGGVYGEKNAPLSSLREILSSSKSSLSAGVSGQSASDLTSFLSFAMDNTKPTIVSGVPEIVGHGPHLVVVELPTEKGEQTFRAHDTIISKTKSVLERTNLPYAVFYTADHTSTPALPQYDPPKNVLRRSASLVTANSENDKKLCFSVLDTESNNCSLTNETCPVCVLMCLTPEIRFQEKYMEDNETVFLSGVANGTDNFVLANGSCGTTDGENLPYLPPGVFFSYIAFDVLFDHSVGNESRGTYNHSIFFTFIRGDCDKSVDGSNLTDCGFWTMQIFAGVNTSQLDLYNQRHTGKVFSRLGVPLTNGNTTSVSYACGSSSLNNYTRGNASYQFMGIQVEPFASIKPDKNNQFHFGSAYNCQGYFGHLSFMGVVTVIILLVFLYLATVFIFSMQSNDRFDDPRGETIKVENLH